MTFKPSDIADIWENPNFSKMSFEDRGAVLENIIGGAAEYARNAPDYDADVQRTMNKLIDASRAKLGDSESLGEKGKWAAGVAGQTIVDSAKVVVATGADAGFVQDDNQTGEIEGKVPLENVGKGLWTGAQGIWEAAGHHIAAITHREESKAVEGQLDTLKAQIDNADYPLKSRDELKRWLSSHDVELNTTRKAWIKAADTQADDAAIEDQVKSKSLTKDPEILQNLVEYMRNRTPGTWDAVRRKLIETPTTAKLNQERDSVKETPVGRFLDTINVGSDMLVAAGDPLDNALVGLIPVGKGASMAKKGFKAAMKSAAVGIGAETLSEVGSLLTENPDATMGEVADTAKAGAIGAGGLTAVGAAGGKGMQMWKGQPVQDAAETPASTTAPATVEGVAVPEPEAPFTTTYGDYAYHFDGQMWMKPNLPSSLDELDGSPNLPTAMVPMNPADVTDGTLLPQLEAKRKAANRKKQNAGPAAAFEQPVQESVAPVVKDPLTTEGQNPTDKESLTVQIPDNESDIQTPVSESSPVVDSTVQSGPNVSGDTQPPSTVTNEQNTTPQASKAKSAPRSRDSLPDATGTDSDLISALKRTGTLAVSDGPEFDWYRQLEKDAKSSPLKKQTIEAMARRGELNSDASVTLEWLRQNRIVSKEGGKKIDEAVSELTGSKLAEDDTTFDAFKVDAANLGDLILAAIDARLLARDQGTYDAKMTEEERLVVAAERELASRFIGHAIGSPGVPMSGNALSNEAVVGSKIDIGGKTFTVAEVDSNAGTVDVEGEFGYQRIFAEDEVNVTSIDGQKVEDVEQAEGVDMPFSMAESLSEGEVTKAENAKKLKSVGLPAKAGTIINAGAEIIKALQAIAADVQQNRLYRAIAEALKNQNFDGVDLRIEADGRRSHAGYYLSGNGIREIGINIRHLGRGQVDSVGTFLHEALHHTTLEKIQNPQGEIETEAVKALTSLVKRVKAYAASQQVGKKYDYELSNVEEFVSAMFTRPDFQNFLAGIPDNFAPSTAAGKFRSVLSEIMRVLAQLVTGKDVATGSVMEQAMTATLALFDTEQRASSEQTTLSPADTTYLPMPPKAMRLVSERISQASESLAEMLKEHKATRDKRTVDGEEIEPAGYLVRRDADMEAMADSWLDDIAEQQARLGLSMDEIKGYLSEVLNSRGDHPQRQSVDIAAVMLTRLKDGRGDEFGFDPKEVQVMAQKNAGLASAALREQQKILDPLDKLVASANTNTGETLAKAFGVDVPKRGNPADVIETLHSELASDIKSETEQALVEALEAVREQLSETESANDTAIQQLTQEAESLRKDLAAATNELAKVQSALEADISAAGLQGTEVLAEAESLIQSGQTDFKGWSDSMVGKFGQAIQSLLARIWQFIVSKLPNDAAKNMRLGSKAKSEAVQLSNEGNLNLGDVPIDPNITAITKLRAKVRDLQKKLKEVEESLAEEKARADQEMEVGVAIGREEKATANFEAWVNGTVQEGQPTVEDVAKKFITPQGWDGERFRAAVSQIFQDVNPNMVDRLADAVTNELKMPSEKGVSKGKASRLEKARKKAITKFMDKQAARSSKRGKNVELDNKFATFYDHLQKASALGILNSQFFADAFSAAWGLNGLTPAIIAQLRQTYQEITAVDASGQPVLSPMIRETLEREFNERINRIAPAQGWMNFLFSQYIAKVLSSISSMVNQFSRLGVQLTPMSAIQRAYQAKQLRPGVVMSEYASDVKAFFEALPTIMNSLRGESLGNLPSNIASGYLPTAQNVQYMKKGERLRVGKGGLASKFVALGPVTWLARMQELWTWRTIKAAEGLTATIDSGGHFRMVLTNHHIAQGMKPKEARAKAIQDTESSPEMRAQMEEIALKDQAAGRIGKGNAIRKLHVEQLIRANIDQRLGIHAVARQQQITAHAQFKTMPTGFVGFAVSRGMMFLSPSNKGLARFWLMFPRFLGHTVDVTLGYMPIAHLLNKKVSSSRDSRQQKIILEVFGSEEAYQRMTDARAISAAALALSVGGLAMLALGMQGDDEEPFFAVTGSAPSNDRDVKDALLATGTWGEQQVRVMGVPVLNYGQLPELAPVLGVIGNISDAYRFNKILHQRSEKDRERPGKRQTEAGPIGMAITLDYAMSPIKRSTYRQWAELITGSMSATNTGQTENWLEKLGGVATKPIEGASRIPLVVDLDKFFKRQEGGSRPDGFAQSVLRRLPFAESVFGVGTETFNAYGERTPAWDIISALPSDPDFSEEAQRAAKINVETGTRRGLPQAPGGMEYQDGTKREATAEELSKYYQISGKLYTESLLKNEENIRRAYDKAVSEGGNGPEAAGVIVRNISNKARDRAKERLGLNNDDKPE